MVYRWNSRDGVESRDPIPLPSFSAKTRNKRQNINALLHGVFVVLVVDVTKCTLDGRSDCFSKVESVSFCLNFEFFFRYYLKIIENFPSLGRQFYGHSRRQRAIERTIRLGHLFGYFGGCAGRYAVVDETRLYFEYYRVIGYDIFPFGRFATKTKNYFQTLANSKFQRR